MIIKATKIWPKFCRKKNKKAKNRLKHTANLRTTGQTNAKSNRSKEDKGQSHGNKEVFLGLM